MEKPSLDATDRSDPVRSAVNAFVRRIAARVPEGASILDAGAGEGIYRPLFSGRRYIAVDRGVGDAAWDYARLEAVSDLERLPFSGGSFVWVLCTETLEHIRRPLAVLTELRRVLKPGGSLALSVPFLQALHQEPHDYFRYTPHGLRALLTDAGYGDIEIEAVGGYFALLQHQLRSLPVHLPLGVGVSPRSWLTWPARALVRGLAASVRGCAGALRSKESAGTRPLQVFAVARRIA